MTDLPMSTGCHKSYVFHLTTIHPEFSIITLCVHTVSVLQECVGVNISRHWGYIPPESQGEAGCQKLFNALIITEMEAVISTG